MRRPLVLLLLAAAGCGAPPLRIARPPKAGEPTLRVLTYNVNFGLAGDREGLNAIRAADGDLVLLQETTRRWEEAIRTDLADLYPYMQFHHSGGAGGMAALAKRPFEDGGVLPAESWFPAWIVRAQTELGTVQVLNIHLRPGFGENGGVVSGYFTTPRIREKEIAAFAGRLDETLPTLVVGDFNEDEDGRALKRLEANGFRTALPEFAPKAKTWRWPTSLIDLTGRFDHVVYDARLEPLSIEVLEEQGRSDHLPLLAVFTTASGG